MSRETLGVQSGDCAQVSVLQVGARRHYAVPRILHKAGLLSQFHTDFYSGTHPRLRSLLEKSRQLNRGAPARRWLSRNDRDLPASKVSAHHLKAFRFLWDQKRAGSDRARLADAVSRHSGTLARSIRSDSLKDATAVYGFNGMALEFFEAAKLQGLRCILDQTMAPRRLLHAILEREKERWPGWEMSQTAPPGGDILTAREETEWEMADTILCPSEFVVDAMKSVGVDNTKLQLVPFGSGIKAVGRSSQDRYARKRPLRVLFAGQVGLRKGAPYLLTALGQLPAGSVEARMVGHTAIKRKMLELFEQVATFPGGLPRTEMQNNYKWADVLVLPSLIEGSAQVIFEALANGLPVICSVSSGPPTVSSGMTILPEVSVAAIVDALAAFIDEPSSLEVNPDIESEISEESYGRRLASAIVQTGSIA